MIDLRTYNEHMLALATTLSELATRVRQLEAVQIPLGGVLGPHDILSLTHIDSTAAVVVRGDVITGQGLAATWTRLPLGAVNTVLTSDGTDALWQATAAVNHNLLSAVHPDTDPDSPVSGDIIRASDDPASLWERYPIGTHWQLLGVNAGQTLPEWQSFDWDFHVIAAGGDGVHDHSNDSEGGILPVGSITAHNLLSATHGDTTVQAVSRGSIVTGQGVAPTWNELVLGGITGSLVTRDASDVLWSTGALSFAGAFTLTVPASGTAALGTGTATQVAYWSGTNTITGDAGMTYDAANDSLTLLSAVSGRPVLLFENTNVDADSAQGTFYKNSASPADADALGTLNYYGNDSGGVQTRFAYIQVQSSDVSDGDEAGAIRIVATMDGTEREFLAMRGYNGSVNEGQITFNETGQDVDTRVEAVGVTDALQIRGSDGQITLGVLTAGYVNSDAGGVLSVTATATPTVHNVLDSTYHGDVLTGAITRGDILYGNATPKIARLALGGITGSLVTRNATDVLWSTGALAFSGAFTLTVPATGTAVLGGGSGASPRVAYWSDANTLTSDAGLTVDAGGNGYVVADDGYVGITADVRTVYDSSSGYIVETLGDAAGSDEWRVNDSGAGNVASIDSDGYGYFAGHVGIGAAASTAYLLQAYDNALNTTATFYGIYDYVQKTAGASDENDTFHALNANITLNQAGGVYGYTIGGFLSARLDDGTIGAGGSDRYLIGAYNVCDLNGGTINGAAYGTYSIIDQEAANTVTTNVYGHYINVDADGTVTGTVYMLYLAEQSSIDYGIYQNGAAPNRFGGNVIIDPLTASTVIYADASKTITSLANAAGYLTNNGAGALSWSATATATAHALLSAIHNDTTPAAVVRGDIITGQGAGATWTRLALGGATGSFVTRNATDVLWSGFYLAGTAGQTYTGPTTSGTFPTAAGTLTAATANGITAAGVITHAITNTADGDTTPSTILSTDANGTLRVRRLGVGVAAIAANGTIALPDAGYIGNGSATARLVFDSSGADYVAFMTAATEYARIAAAAVSVSNASYFSALYDTNAAYSGLAVTNANAGNAAQARAAFVSDAATMYVSVFGSGNAVANWADKGGLFAAATLGGMVLESANTIQFDTAAAVTKFYFDLSNGRAGINTTTLSGQMAIDQSAAAGAVPVLYLDQGDASEQHIVCSMDAADQDFPNILQLDVTGDPALWWDESENSFGLKNISGLLVQDADWIGNSGTTARLVFDSSGATDYAYFDDCTVGVGITTPVARLDIGQPNGGWAIIAGANVVSEDARTDNIRKYTRIGMPHYTNAEEPTTLIVGDSNTTVATVNMGGGSAAGNIATLLRFHTAADTITTGESERMRIDSAGIVYINDTANANMALGLTINQGANDNEILAGKSSDVAHPFTDYAEADTYFSVNKHSATAGGTLIGGFRDSDDDAGWALVLRGYLGENAPNGKLTTSGAITMIDGFITDGGTGVGNINADGNVAAFRTWRGGALTTVVIVDEDGDIYYDGALVPYDDYDDALAVRDAKSVLTGRWNEALTYNAAALAKMGVISLNADGTPAMVSHKRMTALMAGAIGQLYERVQSLEARLEAI